MSAPFTHLNLDAVKDSAAGFGHAGLEARFARSDLEAEATGIAHQRLAPGKRSPFGHRHLQAEEVYVVIGGGGRVRLDDEIRDVVRLDAIRVAPGVVRAFEAGPNGLEILVFGPHHEADGEIVRGFWDA